MAYRVRIHFADRGGFDDPHLWLWHPGSAIHDDLAASGSDAFGPYYDVVARWPSFGFKFKEGRGTAGPWEDASLDRFHQSMSLGDGADRQREIWCVGDRAFVYDVPPVEAEEETAAAFLQRLLGTDDRVGRFIPDTAGLTGLGAHVLGDGRVLFGLYHPNAATVHVAGSFNGWQRPGHDQPQPDAFVPLNRYRGYFGDANLWLAVTETAGVGDEYKYFVHGGVPRDHRQRFDRAVVDPYARQLAADFRYNNPIVVDPSRFRWSDAGWMTPDPRDLILYELSVHGFTEGDADITEQHRGRFAGVTERIAAGYFDTLGVTALCLMPLAEVPSPQGPHTLGYDPSLFLAVERDFGAPDDLRQLVDTAHRHGLALVIDVVFNHTSNSFNPLWQLVLEHPGEESAGEGGLYFNGATPWGNRIATEKTDVQTMLIDACKTLVREYHVDGFRFDATHSYYMDHGFLRRLADEITTFAPDILLIAENLPNERDLNRQGWNGYAQWSGLFHDKMKALLREGPFEGWTNDTVALGDAFYFSRAQYADHTNNVVNYCESHDEHSVPYELRHTPWLNHPAAKERKGRLGLFATAVALGQPMIYMGQEFNVERERSIVTVQWPERLDDHGFFQWARRLLHLRRRYPGLRLSGFGPAATGQFTWILGPWMDEQRGGNQKVLGWRARPDERATDTLIVLLNFEGATVTVDIDLGLPGRWVKLADIDRVNDIPPNGANSVDDPAALHSGDGRFTGFDLPSSSGFVYKWQAPL